MRQDDAATARAEAARRKIADWDERLRKYRQVLKAGADALIVAGSMHEGKRNGLARNGS